MKNLFLLVFYILLLTAEQAQSTSEYALRFYGTGVGPPGQQDRILLAVDDNQAGDNSTPIDVGADSFTYEFWLRGRLADNATNHAGGDVEMFDYTWIEGNIILDRDVWCGTERNFGVSLAGGKIRFGVGEGDSGVGFSTTIEGSEDVLDDTWHHVAVVRNIGNGSLMIVVDGVVDFSSSLNISLNDLSYPDAGIPVTGDCSTGQLTDYGWYLVVAAEKHDAGSAYPSYNGFMDELRIWNTARTLQEIQANRFRVIDNNTPGLVGHYRFESGSGTAVIDSSAAGAPTGQLIAGVAANGEWVSRVDDINNTAPLSDVIFADGFQ